MGLHEGLLNRRKTQTLSNGRRSNVLSLYLNQWYVARRPRIVAPAGSTILRRVVLLRSCLVIAPLISCEVFNTFNMEFWPLSRSRSWDSSKSLNVKRFKRREGSTSLVPQVSHTWPYMQPHTPSRYSIHIGNTRWHLASAWCSWG